MNHAALVEQYRRLKDELLTEHPDLRDDTQTLTDSLEGATEITDTVCRYIRDAIEDETLSEALENRIKQMRERKDRLADRATRRRSIALSLMSAVGMEKLQQPDFTVGIRAVPPKVLTPDEAQIPDRFWKVVRTLDKMALRDALSSGEIVPGATLSNGSTTLAIRTR